MTNNVDLSVRAFQNSAIALTCYKILTQIEEGSSIKDVENYVRYLGEKALRKTVSSSGDEIDMLL
jgi:hypothetical protein